MRPFLVGSRPLACCAAFVACSGCGFPDFAADLDDGTVDDSAQDAGGDAGSDADVRQPDALGDATDAEVHADADAPTDGGCTAETGALDASGCTSCAVSRCGTELMNCQSSAACKAFIDCTSTCRCESAAACFTDCKASHPSPEADALGACLASNCATECS